MSNDIINLINSFYGITSSIYSSRNMIKWTKMNIFKNIEIKSIKCGYDYILFLDVNGILYINQIIPHYVTQRNFHWNPIKIEYFINNKIKIKQIECCYNSNLAIDVNNMIYLWSGWKLNDKLNIIDTLKNENIINIKCGSNHYYAVTDNNKHYLWENNQ